MDRSFMLAATIFIYGVLGQACQDGNQVAVTPTSPTLTVAAANPTEAPAGAIGYQLLVPESFVYWKGRPVAGKGHEGTIKPLSGDLAIEDKGQIVGGYFELDMQSIHSTDIQDKGGRESLESHLKDGDFFDVGKFPKASFMLLKAVRGANDSSYSITGQLTLKSITREINFPATIAHKGDSINARASLLIDRTLWGVTYQSGKLLSTVKENLLEDLVPVSLNLVFKKK
ncbi:YceI family protein [Paraflavitalea sp. CAU 1676]|uniref:YceI family protein n=1 Tax=Paraflavitalea sp. CAU 1676 TaxID=3032598 RepID=UPI0023DB4DDB|nr:YceI family protein [Paraflavitalea sp. CAU 1676]MDF2188641.1 YceI family protein [Paraflavitalea sp. CAU 1676]